MTSALVQKLKDVRDLRKILETTVQELGETLACDVCQIMLNSPLDENATAICEYRSSAKDPADSQPTYLPLVLPGKARGQLSLSRTHALSPDEISSIRSTLAELGDIVKHAQINDVVQRETFRNTFLVEIGNVMSYSLGIGDALFMVVNILGKVLNSSRCLFICTDDTQAGWKCYEYWQQNQVQSCQQYCWPTTDSALVAQTLLSSTPFMVYEGQENSFVAPVQEELQFLGIKSALGVPLNTDGSTHGCVIIQQCDYRRAWNRGEVDMVQSVADEVAKALVKLPTEKLVREPIMQLHQRIVPKSDSEHSDIQSVRRALKGALGIQAIPVAQKTTVPVKLPEPAAPAAASVKFPETVAPVAVSIKLPEPIAPAPVSVMPPESVAPMVVPPVDKPPQKLAAKESSSLVESVTPVEAIAPVEIQPPFETKPEVVSPIEPAPAQAAPPAKGKRGKSLNSILGSGKKEAAPSALDFGPTEDTLPVEVAPVFKQPAEQLKEVFEEAAAAKINKETQNTALDSIQLSTHSASAAQPVFSAAPEQPVAQAPVAPPLSSEPPSTQWGDLDSIPTPAAGPTKLGLSSAILNKGKGAPSSASSLMASLHKDKSKFVEPELPKAEFVEGPPVDIDENAAQAKLDQILSGADSTSDYIFATPGVDARVLGRIDGWVIEIEEKDKYASGHARPVAQYSVAIAEQLGLSAQEITNLRLAAFIHDVGKLGLGQPVLQKSDEELTDSELLLVMKHPIDGAELLESFPDLKHLTSIVRAHHEEFDGNGYPDGLKGEDIPLLARIIHVANSYHSMTSPLKTRPAQMSSVEAQQALTKGAGTQWDPKVVEALILTLMQQKVPATFS